jgi:hypothetical protein
MAHQFLLLTALLQVQPAQPQLPASPIDRIAVTPANPSMNAQDTLRLHAQALDAAGNVVPGARLRFVPSSGARFEGTVEESGLVRSTATGTLPVTIIATVPGTAPVTQRVEVAMVPGPAARIAIGRAVDRLVVGQRVLLEATSLSALGDRRDDRIAWRSSAAAVARVGPDGLLTAVAPGRATITASAGNARTEIAVQVVADDIGIITITPATSQASRRLWSFTPGHGMIDEDGAFVGYEGARTPSSPVSASAARWRRCSSSRATSAAPPRSWDACRARASRPRRSGSTRTAATCTSAAAAAATSCTPSTSAIPSQPFVTDSLVANTRRVNDVMTTPDGRYLVHTREGAADRRNGIVIAQVYDPAHPKVIAEFTRA